MLVDRNRVAVANDYVRLTFKAQDTFLSSESNIQRLVDEKTRGLGNGLIVVVPASYPTVASNSILGIAYAYLTVTMRVSSAAGKRWDDLLRPLDCFGGVVLCNIQLDSAEMITNNGSVALASGTTAAQKAAATAATKSGANPLKSNPVTSPVVSTINAIPNAAKETSTLVKFVSGAAIALAVFGLVYEIAPLLKLAKK